MTKKSPAMLALLTCFAGFAQAQTVTSKVPMYYIAADEVDWDYSPELSRRRQQNDGHGV